MAIEENQKNQIADIAQSSLGAFDAIAGAAERQLVDDYRVNVDPRNSFTDTEATQFVGRINQSRLDAFEILIRQPAIARVQARDQDGNIQTFFITRAAPTMARFNNARVASYGGPIGRISERHAGEEFDYLTPNGLVTLQVIEVAKLFPTRDDQGWDSRNSIVEGHALTPVTITSLREFLVELSSPDDLDILDAILAEEKEKRTVKEGIRRNVIIKMGLRDQPILDRMQGDIFRLPLDKRLLLLGAPGTGKTTTLIRRLGQKIDIEHLDDREKQIVAALNQQAPHSQSWLMFTPTDLLQQYIKEAFNREQIPASNDRIVTWTDYRWTLGRSRLGILQTATSSGRFIFRPAADHLTVDATASQTAWFQDFFTWQSERYWSDAADALRELASSEEAKVTEIAKQLEKVYGARGKTDDATTFGFVIEAASDIRDVIDEMKKRSDAPMRTALNKALKHDRSFLDAFGNFLNTLIDEPEEEDEAEAEEDEQATARVGRDAAMNAYMQAIRIHSRAVATGRVVSVTSRTGRIIQWLGKRMPGDDECRNIGRSVRTQEALRRHLHPVRRYIDDVPLRYRQFRRLRQSEGRWYRPDAKMGRDIGPFELDVVLLATLLVGGGLLRDRRVMADVERPAFAALKRIKDLYKNQIVVDEMADFSPLQLAAMAALADPRLNSFFACGDFNQRLTDFGVKTRAELEPFFLDLDVRTVQITYRHTRQLNEFARAIVTATGADGSTVALPENVDSEGVMPVLVKNLSSWTDIANWLAERMPEIERASGKLPSIAVLVNAESDVHPLAEALSIALQPQNLRAEACPEGKVIGQESDVRVFDVQYIKGLEFEAVFFVGVDQLAALRPTLFDKYLYVGATRAATFLGLTCHGDRAPELLEVMPEHFGHHW